MRIYTLRKPFEDELRSILNGQLFAVSKNNNTGHLRFVGLDIRNHVVLFETSSVQSSMGTDDGVIFCTSNGTIYDLVDVSTLIPTKALVKVCDGFNPENVKVISEDTSVKHAYYCDGKVKTRYLFERELSKEEFCRFLTEVKHTKIILKDETTYPYQDYYVIAGSGKEWKLTRVSPYTD